MISSNVTPKSEDRRKMQAEDPIWYQNIILQKYLSDDWYNDETSISEQFAEKSQEIKNNALERFDIAMEWVIETAEYNAKIQVELYKFKKKMSEKHKDIESFLLLLIQLKENKYWDYIESQLWDDILKVFQKISWITSWHYTWKKWESFYDFYINVSWKNEVLIKKTTTTTVIETLTAEDNTDKKRIRDKISQLRNKDFSKYRLEREIRYLFIDIYWKIVHLRRTLENEKSEESIIQILRILLENSDIVNEMVSQWLIKNHDKELKKITLDGNATNLIWKVHIEYGWEFKFAYYEGLKYRRYWEEENRLTMT